MQKYFLIISHNDAEPDKTLDNVKRILEKEGYPTGFFSEPGDSDLYLLSERDVDEKTIEKIRALENVGGLGFGYTSEFILDTGTGEITPLKPSLPGI